MDNADEEQAIVNRLLSEGVEVYESDEEFYEKYPPLTPEERMGMGRNFFGNP